MQNRHQSSKTHDDYKIAIICSLDFELNAVRYMLDREHPQLRPNKNDTTLYYFGELSHHDVVVACPPGKTGKSAAAIVATNLSHTFPSIELRLMVGIAGGVPTERNDIRLGDVVISMPMDAHAGVVQYDLGRDTDDGFEIKGYLTPPPPLLINAITRMKSAHSISENKIEGFLSQMIRRFPGLSNYARPTRSDKLFESDYRHKHGESSCRRCNPSRIIERNPRSPSSPRIHYGLIASGDSVIKSGRVKESLVRRVGDILCFEMEAAGVMTGFPCVVIRGISDYADSHKNDAWQHYAAATAAASVKELLEYVAPENHTTNTSHGLQLQGFSTGYYVPEIEPHWGTNYACSNGAGGSSYAQSGSSNYQQRGSSGATISFDYPATASTSASQSRSRSRFPLAVTIADAGVGSQDIPIRTRGDQLRTSSRAEQPWTEIRKDEFKICHEAIDLVGYSYEETRESFFINRSLSPVST